MARVFRYRRNRVKRAALQRGRVIRSRWHWLLSMAVVVSLGGVVAAGGRVLNVCATASSLLDALRRAYAAAAEIDWPSKILRHDIGRRVLEGTQQGGEG